MWVPFCSLVWGWRLVAQIQHHPDAVRSRHSAAPERTFVEPWDQTTPQLQRIAKGRLRREAPSHIRNLMDRYEPQFPHNWQQPVFWDVIFSTVQGVFLADGTRRDSSYIRRIDKFLEELIWMAKTLRYGREHISLEQSQ